MKLLFVLLVTLLTPLFPSAAEPARPVKTVRDAAELRAALGALQPGTTLKIAPGEYPGGQSVRGVARLTVGAIDPQNPPHFKGGSGGWHFSQCDGQSVAAETAGGRAALTPSIGAGTSAASCLRRWQSPGRQVGCPHGSSTARVAAPTHD
jgi:hypothetical protein